MISWWSVVGRAAAGHYRTRRRWTSRHVQSHAAAGGENGARVGEITIPVKFNRRSNLIFGANTGVGKTVVACGLVQASLKVRETTYVKPLQTGSPDEDQSFVERYASNQPYPLQAKTLFSWATPTSPHTASLLENQPVSGPEILTKLSNELAANQKGSNRPVTTYIETAGGVLSPTPASPLDQQSRHAISSRKRDGTSNESWGWTTQADLYQPLLGQLPVILVGDGRLGGISTTLAALESLLVRGYDISALVLINNSNHDQNDTVDNLTALREYAQRKLAMRTGSGEVLFSARQSMISLPPLPSDPKEPLFDWYTAQSEQFSQLDHFLDQSWQGQVSDLQAMPFQASRVVWWPFTQHGSLNSDKKDVTLIDSASGDYYNVVQQQQQQPRTTTSTTTTSEPPPSSSQLLERTSLFDACASWWTQGLGHGDSSLALACAAAAGRYGHVLYPQVVHAPALSLTHRLLQGPGKGWAQRVFFTDDGSTAVEVAIKMGMKLFHTRLNVNDYEDHELIDWVVCGQKDCYHGDTLGVMDVAEPSIFNEGQHPWYESKGLFLDTPTLGFQDGVLRLLFPDGLSPTPGDHFEASYEFETVQQALDVDARKLTSLFSHYKEMIEMQIMVYEHMGVNRKIGCIVIEPILVAAGGMKFVDPLWQRALIDIAKSRQIPVIFDEVASGLYRLGVSSCREILKVDPDIACYAKLLTGGLLPLSATLATEEVFNCFLGDEKGQALLHGHSYTAHPVGCVASLHALDAYEAVLKSDMDLFEVDRTRALSKLPLVETSFSLGTVLAVHIQTDGKRGYEASSRTFPIVQRLRKQGIYARPLGNVIYLMASPLTEKKECSRIARILFDTIEMFGREM